MAELPTFTEQYTTRTDERERWGDGPWDTEPDKAVWTDETTGLAAMIVRGPVGALCGYVGITEAHPWHGLGYSECTLPAPCAESYCNHAPESILRPHGGITFADGCNDSAPDHRTAICHLDPNGGETWWFGFDCAHHMDLAPGMKAHGFRTDGEVYRDFPFVVAEVQSLAAQLAAVPPAQPIPAPPVDRTAASIGRLHPDRPLGELLDQAAIVVDEYDADRSAVSGE